MMKSDSEAYLLRNEVEHLHGRPLGEDIRMENSLSFHSKNLHGYCREKDSFESPQG